MGDCLRLRFWTIYLAVTLLEFVPFLDRFSLMRKLSSTLMMGESCYLLLEKFGKYEVVWRFNSG